MGDCADLPDRVRPQRDPAHPTGGFGGRNQILQDLQKAPFRFGSRKKLSEGEIDQLEYIRLSREVQPGCKPLGKTRYRIPYQGHVLEFDIYPFWQDRAILEIELKREDEGAAIPDYVHIIRDVSADPAYKNRSLAENVVYEEI